MRSCGRSPRISRRRSSTTDRRARGLAATFYHAQSAFEVRGLTRPRSEDIVPERYQEHHVADLLLKELHDLPGANDQWGAKFKVLKESLRHHIQEEEGTMFRLARGVLDRNELHELGEKAAVMKAEQKAL